MAKSKAPSKHSRAARRAASPPVATEKAAATAPGPRPAVLAVHRAAGVQKKKARGRAVSSRARRRLERGAEMAAAVGERTALKTERSAGRARAVQARRRAWDDVNRSLAADVGAPRGGAFGALADGDEDADEDESETADESSALPEDEGARTKNDQQPDELLVVAADDDGEIL